MTATLAGAVRVTVTEREARQAKDVLAVSYTHLTLPTSDLV